MKKIYLLLLISNLAFSQTKKDATDYINYYFNGSNSFENYSGGFTYNSFNNSIKFTSERTISNPMDNKIIGSFSENCLFNLSNIKSIDFKTMLINGKYNIIIQVYLYEDVYRESLNKKTGNLPINNSKNTSFLAFSTDKQLWENDLESFKNAVLFLMKK